MRTEESIKISQLSDPKLFHIIEQYLRVSGDPYQQPSTTTLLEGLNAAVRQAKRPSCAGIEITTISRVVQPGILDSFILDCMVDRDPFDEHGLRGSYPSEETRLATELGVHMREKLRQNSHKAHWRAGTVGINHFLRRAMVELEELREAVQKALEQPTEENKLAVWLEAADVANFAAMTADLVNRGYWKKGREEESEVEAQGDEQ